MIPISFYDFYQIKPVSSRMEIHLNGANEHFQDLKFKFKVCLCFFTRDESKIETKFSNRTLNASINYVTYSIFADKWIKWKSTHEKTLIRLKEYGV